MRSGDTTSGSGTGNGMEGTGFSQTCTDADGDDLCDVSYEIASGHVDALPLRYLDADGDGVVAGDDECPSSSLDAIDLGPNRLVPRESGHVGCEKERHHEGQDQSQSGTRSPWRKLIPAAVTNEGRPRINPGPQERERRRTMKCKTKVHAGTEGSWNRI